MVHTRTALVIVGLLAIAGVAKAGFKFDGFNADGTRYRGEYGGGVCKTGLVDENGAVTTAPVCRDDERGTDFGFFARVPMWGGVWQHEGYSGICSTSVTLTFQKKGRLAAVFAPSDCMGVPLAAPAGWPRAPA